MDDVGEEELGSWSDFCNAEKLELVEGSPVLCAMTSPLLIGWWCLKGKRSAGGPDRGNRYDYHVFLACIIRSIPFQRDFKREFDSGKQPARTIDTRKF